MPAEATSEGQVVNCLMLISWPERREMVREALISFACQDHPNRVLTVVNDGSPCHLTAAFRSRFRGSVVQVAPGTSIGEKRNTGAHAVAADFVASFDDDDFSLPSRLTHHLASIGTGVWLSAARKYIALHHLDKIVGFEYGRCYGAGMISTAVTKKLEWPPMNWCEDQRLYEAAKVRPRQPPAAAPARARGLLHPTTELPGGRLRRPRLRGG